MIVLGASVLPLFLPFSKAEFTLQSFTSHLIHPSSLLSERHEASTVSVQLKRFFVTFTPGQIHRRTFFLRRPSLSWLSPLSLCQNEPSTLPLPEYNSCSFPSSYVHHNALWSTMRGHSKTITLSFLTYPLNLIPVLWNQA